MNPFKMLQWRVWSWVQRRRAARQTDLIVNLGCGGKTTPEGLNLDICPTAKEAVYWDAYGVAGD